MVVSPDPRPTKWPQRILSGPADWFRKAIVCLSLGVQIAVIPRLGYGNRGFRGQAADHLRIR